MPRNVLGVANRLSNKTKQTLSLKSLPVYFDYPPIYSPLFINFLCNVYAFTQSNMNCEYQLKDQKNRLFVDKYT